MSDTGKCVEDGSYRPEIDGLRALAVIAVIINHFDDRLLPSGYLGVDIFFVISGYVITWSLYTNRSDSLGSLLADFYVRRIKRLLPALALCVLSSAIAICLFNPNPASSLKTGIAALFGVSNVFLYHQATDYFGASARVNVFTHTWSLGAEEQFYLFFPFIVWLTGLGRRSYGLRVSAVVIGLLSLASFSLFVFLSINDPSAAFYLMPARFWQLGVGCMTFSIVSAGGNRFASQLPRTSALALIGTIVGVLFLSTDRYVATTTSVVILTGTLIATIKPGAPGYRLLCHPASMYVGRISYSLYLWHWPVVTVSYWTIGIHWWTAPFLATLIFVLADQSHRRLESPLRSAEWSPHRWKVLTYGLLLSLIISVALVGLGRPLKGQMYLGEQPPLIAVGVQTLTDSYSMPDGLSSWQGERCVLTSNDQVGKIIPFDACTLGDFATARHRVLVFGNSFSAAFVQAFDQLVIADRYAITITSSWGASPAPGLRNDTSSEEANTYYWETIAPSLIKHLRPDDWVLLVNDMADFMPARWSPESEESLRLLEAGLITLSDQLAGQGIRLAVLHGNPLARAANCEPSAAIRQWFAPFGGPCNYLSRAETLHRREALDSKLSALEQQGQLSVVDLLPIFCPGDPCTYWSGHGSLLYRDDYSHPSVEAVRLSAPIIRAVLTSEKPTSADRPMAPN